MNTLRRPIIIVIALIPLLCLGGLLVAVFMRPPVFYSHHQVIAYMLRQRGLEAVLVDAALPWPEGVNYYSYGPAVYPFNLIVKVDLSDGRHADGRVECRRDQFDCSLTLSSLGMDRILMPNISNGTTVGMPAWIRALALRIGIQI